jgi:hypothetical protein
MKVTLVDQEKRLMHRTEEQEEEAQKIKYLSLVLKREMTVVYILKSLKMLLNQHFSPLSRN